MRSALLASMFVGGTLTVATSVAATESGMRDGAGTGDVKSVECHDGLENWVPGTLRFDTRTVPGYVVPSQEPGVKRPQSDCVLS